jgi:hypothetical protein
MEKVVIQGLANPESGTCPTLFKVECMTGKTLCPLMRS